MEQADSVAISGVAITSAKPVGKEAFGLLFFPPLWFHARLAGLG
jgi:hypothetical protein